jgi:hypothetical protein
LYQNFSQISTFIDFLSLFSPFSHNLPIVKVVWMSEGVWCGCGEVAHVHRKVFVCIVIKLTYL